MAKKNEPATKKGKSFKGEMPPWHELKEKDSVIGIYQGYKMLTIKDNETGKEKEIRVYQFRDVTDDTKRFAVSGRSLLDAAFDMAWESVGGEERLQGETLAIERGEDTKTGKKRIGNYELTIMEA
jgi:hypothetical protein